MLCSLLLGLLALLALLLGLGGFGLLHLDAFDLFNHEGTGDSKGNVSLKFKTYLSRTSAAVSLPP